MPYRLPGSRRRLSHGRTPCSHGPRDRGMPVPARPRQRRSAQMTGSSPAVLSALLVVTAAGAGAAVGLAPEGARPWVAGTAIAAWGCIAAVVAFASARLRQAHRETVSRTGELEMTKNN